MDTTFCLIIMSVMLSFIVILNDSVPAGHLLRKGYGGFALLGGGAGHATTDMCRHCLAAVSAPCEYVKKIIGGGKSSVPPAAGHGLIRPARECRAVRCGGGLCQGGKGHGGGGCCL